MIVAAGDCAKTIGKHKKMKITVSAEECCSLLVVQV